MLKFRVERLSDNIEEIKDLIDRHWHEVALNQDTIKLDPDWDNYKLLEDAGMFFFLAARDEDDNLVGYHALVLLNNLHYRGVYTANTDVYYIVPEKRTGFNGVRLFKETEKHLKAMGVKKIVTQTKLHTSPEGRNLDMGKVFDYLGYRHIENVHSKVI